MPHKTQIQHDPEHTNSQFHEGTRKHAQRHEKRTHYKCIPHSVWDFRRRPRRANDATTQAKRTQVQVPDPPAINGNPSLRTREKCNRNERHKCFSTRHANIQYMYMCVCVCVHEIHKPKEKIYISFMYIYRFMCMPVISLDHSGSGPFLQRCHCFFECLQAGIFRGKCRQIYHTLMVWVIIFYLVISYRILIFLNFSVGTWEILRILAPTRRVP